jgi:hypothetical protein
MPCPTEALSMSPRLANPLSGLKNKVGLALGQHVRVVGAQDMRSGTWALKIHRSSASTPRSLSRSGDDSHSMSPLSLRVA